MLILYTADGACSTATHMALEASGLDYATVKVDLKAKTLADGTDYLAINPKGAVPALRVGEDSVLTENAVCLQYIADKSGSDLLLPLSGLERYRVLEWTGFIATELHKSFGPLFGQNLAPEARAAQLERVGGKLAVVERALAASGEPFLGGAHPRIADYYLYVILRWTDRVGIDLAQTPALAALRRRMGEVGPVRRVLEATGLAP